MKLYMHPVSTACRPIRLFLAENKIACDEELVDLMKGAHHQEPYASINPNRMVPMLVDGDLKLWETMAIMQYIAGKKPNAAWPNDPRTRADITRWQSWCLAHWNRDVWSPVLFERLVKRFLNLGAPDQAIIAKGVAAYEKETKMLDAHLTKQKYLVGDALTIADFAVASPLFYAKEAELPLAPYSHIRGWFERVSALPCWRETAPQMAAAA